MLLRSLVVALLCATAVATPISTAGQRRADLRTSRPQAAPAPSPVAPTLLSAALPGAGQHVLGQNRKWLYAAVEAAGWVLWAERRGSAREYRDRYRDYAWEGARLQSGPRADGDFDYYERMSKWTRSGAFDADASASGVQPETNTSTYNGSVWALASQIYFSGAAPPPSDPAYQSALAYYQQRAYGTSFLWDWNTGSGEQGELARLIDESDSRFGQATTALGAVIANHLVSAVDAYLSARGRAGPASLRVVPDLGAKARAAHGTGWLLVLRLATSW